MKAFLNKVAAERAALAAVNHFCARPRQLAGLSSVAIEAWRHGVGLAEMDPLVVELKELSELCQKLSDRSHETFATLDPQLTATVQQRIQSLHQLAQRLVR